MTGWVNPPDGFQADLDALPDDVTRKMAIRLANLVRLGKEHGKPLDKRVATGDLSDCLKVYFDPAPVRGQKPRFRLVYRLVTNDMQLVSVQPVSVGRREGLDAYLRAAKNLGR